MSVVCAIVSESRLDLKTFMPAAQHVTGKNHVTATDAKRSVSQLAADLSILNDFAGNEANLSLAATYVGILVAGLTYDVAEIIAYTRGMPHVDTHHVEQHLRCVLIVGNLDQWHKSVMDGCKAHHLSTARRVFNSIYQQLCQKGLSKMFEGTQTKPQRDNTFLLEHK